MNLLALADEAHEHAPCRYPLSHLDKQVRLGRLDTVLSVHLLEIPGPLGLVEHQNVLAGQLALLSIREHDLMDVLNEDRRLQRVLEHVNQWPVPGQEQRAIGCRGLFIDQPKTHERLPRARYAGNKGEQASCIAGCPAAELSQVVDRLWHASRQGVTYVRKGLML